MTTRPIVIVDTETTGLDAHRYEIIDIAVLRVHPHTLAVEREYAAKIRPEHPELTAPDALETNAYTPERWADALDARTALAPVLELIEGCTWLGHNPAFDIDFLSASCARLGLPAPQVHHRRIDTIALAWPLLLLGEVESLSLDLVCKHLGIASDGAHTALGDVHRALDLVRRLAHRYVGFGELELLHAAA